MRCRCSVPWLWRQSVPGVKRQPSVAMRLEAEAGETRQGLVLWEARGMPGLDAAEECRKRLVQPAQRHLLAGAVRGLGPVRAEVGHQIQKNIAQR